LAVNKRKVLEAARKHAQKGAKEKALKEYNTLLKLDPRDAKLHLEIGDAHRRWGQMDEAVTQYTRVAEQYKQDGFDARAVAVYKQILNIDSKRYSAHEALADVYQRMGLEAEAIQALQSAADGYRQEGKKREALELLRKMAQLDPTNTTSRLKVAELLQQEGMEDDAVAEYEAVVEELRRSGAGEQVPAIYERILELRPARGDLLLAMSRHYLEQGEAGRAEPFASRALEIAPAEPELHELLCEIYRALDRPDELESATRTLAQIYRERGDEERARQIMQRLPSAPELDAPAPEAAPEAPEPAPEDALGIADAGDLLDEDELLVADDDDFDDPSDDSAPLPAPEGDPDQLFAEASVYLRYGKRDQAIASLEAILVQEPSHRDALEKLGEAHADAGADARAVECWSRAAELARDADDAGGFDILHDRISALDPGAASALGPGPAGDADEAGAEGLGDEELEEFDFDVEDETVAAPEDDGGLELVVDDDPDDDPDDDAVAIDDPGPDLTGDVEVDLDDIEFETGVEGADALDAEGPEAAPDDDALGDFDVDVDLDVDLDGDLDVEVDAGDAGESPAADASEPGGSTTTAQEIQEELEEAEFYFEQDLLDEAEALYRRVLEKAPSHPSALLRIGEIEARRGEADGSGDTAPDEAEGVFDGGLDDDTLGSLDDEELAIDDDDGGAPEEGDDDLAAALAEAADSAGGDEEDDTLEAMDRDDVESDIAFDVDEGLGDDTTEVVEAADVPDAVAAEVTQPVTGEEDDTPSDDVAEEGFDLGAELSQDDASLRSDGEADDEADDEDAFDLGAELRESFEEEQDPNAASGTSTGDDGFAAIFNDFKRGVSETLSDGDYQTRYDLGIAYREMELFDDAIGEFRMCLASDGLRLGSLHLMALCALELGRGADAVGHLEQALATGELAEEQRVGIQFDLGRAYRAQGDVERARSAFESVRSVRPDFPELDEQLASLDDPEAGTEELERFDDLLAEAESDEEAAAGGGEAGGEPEAFESFDDVIAEAQAVAVDEPEAEAVVEAELVPEDEQTEAADVEAGPDEAAPEPGPARRKKKISFV